METRYKYNIETQLNIFYFSILVYSVEFQYYIYI